MKGKSFRRIAVLAITLIATVSVSSLADSRSRFQFVFGPRVGATYVMVEDWDAYDETMQVPFPDTDRQYFPIITQFGVNLEQRIRLGGTQSHFAFQEVLLVGGIDQNTPLPSLSMLIGFRSHAGLEIGLGPNLSMSVKNNVPVVAMSVVIAAGWTFSFNDVYVPVNIAIVPTPRDSSPRLTILTGFNFHVGG